MIFVTSYMFEKWNNHYLLYQQTKKILQDHGVGFELTTAYKTQFWHHALLDSNLALAPCNKESHMCNYKLELSPDHIFHICST